MNDKTFQAVLAAIREERLKTEKEKKACDQQASTEVIDNGKKGKGS